MKIPKYIQEIMARSTYYFDFDSKDKRYAAGYTIIIRKPSPYTQVETFKKELVRLQKFCARHDTLCLIVSAPQKTHYTNSQTAIVTIFDPLMMQLEKYIKS